MAFVRQPAQKSYFFGKGYSDVEKTIKGALDRNSEALGKFKLNIIKAKGEGLLTFLFLAIINILAMLSVIVFGYIITAIVSILNIVLLLILFVPVYIGFCFIWLADRIYLMKNRIFTACPECKERTLIPTYLCPKCGARHSHLSPGLYGILHRVCTGENPSFYCGEVLPTAFFNGRGKLKATCSHCSVPLAGREAVPICIPVVGGRSVGKTAFITAFSKIFIDEVAPSKSWNIEFYDEKKANIYKEIERDYFSGSTRMTERPQDVKKASSISFSFFVKGEPFFPERLVHIYDIAGEVFTEGSENEAQKQYEYCQGIVMIIDPFSIPAFRHRFEHRLDPMDKAGIGQADINVIVDSFLNKLREATGLSAEKMSSVPLAVVINKIDSAGLSAHIGDRAVRYMMTHEPKKFSDYYDTQDYLCREFLRITGMEAFLNSIDLKFKYNRFFSCSAIGHCRDQGPYHPEGVLAPMQWLFGKADSKMEGAWDDIKFSS